MFAACRVDYSNGDAIGELAGREPSVLSSPPEMMDECSHWLDEARSLAEKEYTMRFFDRLKTIFTKWIWVHYVISGFLFALLVVHVITTLYYGLRWLP